MILKQVTGPLESLMAHQCEAKQVPRLATFENAHCDLFGYPWRGPKLPPSVKWYMGDKTQAPLAEAPDIFVRVLAIDMLIPNFCDWATCHQTEEVPRRPDYRGYVLYYAWKKTHFVTCSL
jgi:hypothetical protein